MPGSRPAAGPARRRRSQLVAVGITVAVVVLAACNDDDGPAGDPPDGDDVTTTTAAASAGGFEEEPCPSGSDEAVEIRCGTVAVPADHDDPEGGTIELALGVIPADGDGDATPIFLLGGGPGEHAVDPILGALTPDAPLLELTASRDVVIIDQRGAGASQPALECPDLQESLASVTDTDGIAEAAIEGITACRERLVDDEGVDLSAFSTPAAVIDLDVVRQALGYERVSLVGTSYGARLALQAARQYPDTIESVALSSPVPAEANFVVDVADSFDRAIAAIGDACAADPACDDAYPDLTATVQRLVTELDAEPATIEITDPASDESAEVPVDGATFATILFGLFYAPDGPATFPYLVTAIAEGDLSPLEELAAMPVELLVSQGQQLSFLCAEEAADAGPDELTTGDLEIGSKLIETNPVLGRTLWDLCEVRDVEPAGGDLFDRIETDVPLLVVTGEFDQITPPSYGETIVDAAETAWYVEVEGFAHSPLLAAGPCAVALLDTFVAEPTEPPDPGCEIEDPGFASPDDIDEMAEEPTPG